TPDAGAICWTAPGVVAGLLARLSAVGVAIRSTAPGILGLGPRPLGRRSWPRWSRIRSAPAWPRAGHQDARTDRARSGLSAPCIASTNCHHVRTEPGTRAPGRRAGHESRLT